MLLRADSTYYTAKVITAARHAGARFSITVPSNRSVRAPAATLRCQIINVPAQLAHRAHGIVLHLPTHWPPDTRRQTVNGSERTTH